MYFLEYKYTNKDGGIDYIITSSPEIKMLIDELMYITVKLGETVSYSLYRGEEI